MNERMNECMESENIAVIQFKQFLLV